MKIKKLSLFLIICLQLNTGNLFAQYNRLWATYYGGSADDDAYSVTTDSFQNVYLSGQTPATTGIASGGFQNIFGGGQYDAFLVKFDAVGNRLWATYYGGPSVEAGRCVATDTSGNVYLAGETFSTSGIASGGFQNTYSGGSSFGDVFLVKFDSLGNRLWATYYGGVGDDKAFGITTDSSGNVYIAGETEGGSSIASGGFQNSYGGGRDAFLVKFSPNGNRLWATYYGGGAFDRGFSVATDIFDNVYLSGMTQSTSGIASGGFQNANAGGTWDAFLVKFNSSGNRLWATYYGGAGDDRGISVATFSTGNVYLAGQTNSASGISSVGFQNNFGGGLSDAYLVKFDSSGSRIWATYYGGIEPEEMGRVVTDVSGNVLIGGDTYSTTGISFDGFQNNLVVMENQFVVRFDENCVRLCATYYGQSHDEEGSIAVDGLGNVYLSGITQSATGISSGGFQNTFGGGNNDAYLVKFTSCACTLSQPTISPDGNILRSSSLTNNQWYRNDTLIAGATNQNYTVSLPVTDTSCYSVMVTENFNCTEISEPYCYYPLPVGFSEIDINFISIYPNPTSLEITINGYSPAYIKLCNIVGQTVTEAIKTNKLWLGNLSQGLYFLQLFDEKGWLVKTEKLVKDN